MFIARQSIDNIMLSVFLQPPICAKAARVRFSTRKVSNCPSNKKGEFAFCVPPGWLSGCHTVRNLSWVRIGYRVLGHKPILLLLFTWTLNTVSLRLQTGRRRQTRCPGRQHGDPSSPPVLRFCPYSYPTDTGVLKHLSIHTQRWVPSVRFSSLYHRITREVTGELEALQKAGRGTN